MKKQVLFGMIVIAIATSASAQAPVKRVLLEEFTGTRCQWSPRGIWAAIEVERKHPGQVIEAAFHNPYSYGGGDQVDPMFCDAGLELEKNLCQYPLGYVDRWAFNTGGECNGYGLDPVEWMSDVEARLAMPVVLDLHITNVAYESSTRRITVKVATTFVEHNSGDLRFNLYVTEDSVTNADHNYDQNNCLSIAGKSYSSYDSTNPFDTLPTTVKGWHHRHVARTMYGGFDGAPATMPHDITAGSAYTQTFSFDLPLGADPARCVVFAAIHRYDSTSPSVTEVLNVSPAVPLTTLPSLADSASLVSRTNYVTIEHGGMVTIPMSLTNHSSVAIQYDLSVSTSSSVLPPGWSVFYSPVTVSASAGETVQFTATVRAPDQAGCAQLVLSATPEYDHFVSLAPVFSNPVFVLSDNIRYALFGPDSTARTSLPAAMVVTAAYLPLDSNILAAVHLESAVFSNVSPLAGYPIRSIEQMLAGGTSVLISSDRDLVFALDPKYSTDPEEASFFTTMMGIQYRGYISETNASTGVAIPFSISGVARDPIGDGMLARFEYAGALAETIQLDTTYPSPVKSCFEFTNKHTPAGFRYEVSDSKLVYLGFDLTKVLNPGVRNTIVERSMKWLLPTSASVQTVSVMPEQNITASPNPFHQMTVIRVAAPQDQENLSFVLADPLGRTILQLPAERNGNDFTARLDAAAIAAGSYSVQVKGYKMHSRTKIVNLR
jgi:hypothetical protein